MGGNVHRNEANHKPEASVGFLKNTRSKESLSPYNEMVNKHIIKKQGSSPKITFEAQEFFEAAEHLSK
jgi:hypothetical protein